MSHLVIIKNGVLKKLFPRERIALKISMIDIYEQFNSMF
jgi:hypothetical protein